jgi:hypothetical protein
MNQTESDELYESAAKGLTSDALKLEKFLGHNRHGHRKARAEARRRVRVLRRMCRTAEDFDTVLAEVVEKDEETMKATLRRRAYAAFHHGRITESEAVLFGCKFERKPR